MSNQYTATESRGYDTAEDDSGTSQSSEPADSTACQEQPGSHQSVNAKSLDSKDWSVREAINKHRENVGRELGQGELDLFHGHAIHRQTAGENGERVVQPNTFLTTEDLLVEARQPTTWTVEDFMYEEALVQIHGREHTGKTYLVLDLGLHLASPSHTEWHGFSIPKTVPVVYIASEGRKTMSKRFASWLDHHALYPETTNMPSIDELMTMEIVEVDPRDIDDPTSRMAFYRWDFNGLALEPDDPVSEKQISEIRARMTAIEAFWGRKPVVIFDVISDFAPGVEENSRDFGHIHSMLRPERINATNTILVHHEGYGNTRRSRGHSSQLGAVDIRVPIEIRSNNYEKPTLSFIKVYQAKNRDEDRPNPFVLTLEKSNPDLKPVITGRPDEHLEPGILDGWDNSKTVNESGLSETQRQILETVNELGGRDEDTSQAEIRKSTGIARSTLSGNLEKLHAKQFVRDAESVQGGVRLTDRGLELLESDFDR